MDTPPSYNTPQRDDHFEPHERTDLPDPGLTPGHVLTYEPATILHRGYAQSVRRVGEKLKRLVFHRYRILWAERWRYDLDHLVPLSLGGSNKVWNLWPHPHDSEYPPRLKMRLERRLRKMVERGWIALRTAQEQLMTNWIIAFALHCGEPPRGGSARQGSGPRVPEP